MFCIQSAHWQCSCLNAVAYSCLHCRSDSIILLHGVIVLLMQLASRLEELTRIKAEKVAEAAALRSDPLGTAINTTQEARARLAALRQQEQQQKQQQAQPAAAAADSDGEQQQQEAPSGSGRAAAAAADDEGDAAAAEGGEGGGGDPYAGMNARQRKLYELKQKMQQARKANENAIIAERKRQRVSSSSLACCWWCMGMMGLSVCV
jgi:DNA segregation ATPase FtsK/SpoIIIE-like protein